MPCLAEGSLILTDNGYEPIEALEVGRFVMDCCGDAHRVLWHGRRHAISVGADAPIMVPENFFGPGVPFLPTRVSQQHRLAVFLPEFGGGLSLVRAKLLFDEGLAQDESYSPITYHHLLFDTHIVMIANGMPTESLLASAGTRKAFGEFEWKKIASALQADPDEVDMKLCAPELRRGQLTRRANQRRKLVEGAQKSVPANVATTGLPRGRVVGRTCHAHFDLVRTPLT